MWVEDLRQARKGKLIGGEILFFPEVESTNRRAWEYSLKGGKEGAVILADSQSKGKGRLGRHWQSPPGVNIYTSIILRPPISAGAAQQITLLAGVAAADSLFRATGLDARIKWPNDILVHGKKVAGILSEMETQGSRVCFLVLGVGVNVNWPKEEIPPNLRETATSLKAEGGKEYSRAEVAAGIFEKLEREYALFLQDGFSSRLREEWNRLSGINQKWVTITVMDEEYEGRVLGVDTDGALLVVNREEELRRFIAGDVSLRLF